MTDLQTFSGWQYLLIDVANHFGLDKELYESRIKWAEIHLDRLEEMAADAPKKTRPLYIKAVQAIRGAQQGKATGHLVGFDAVCSGMQIMSVLTGCIKSATATGLIEMNQRSDAYTEVTNEMGNLMGNQFVVDRDDIKQGVMTSLYGSKEQPKKIFGEDTPELEGFYKAVNNVAPGPSKLLDALLASWQPFTLAHEWRLPDNHCARIKVMEKIEKRLEVDELGGVKFDYEWYENVGQESGVANAANVIHSIDAYLLRTLIRRCNYDRDLIEAADSVIEQILIERELGVVDADVPALEGEALTLVHRYNESQMPDISILNYLDHSGYYNLTSAHLRDLARICQQMLAHAPFPILSVHDEFKCHPNNMNHLRRHYRDILKDMANADMLSDVFSQIYGQQGTYPKLMPNLADHIVCNYGIN
ncbi:DNA-directed RNA polymerase [Vreelandella venusta]|uniref:DNA-directed RNA polymerase n=1 Tax=Vreelandella venusta TaxID=44935 RepID=UPI00116BC1FC|nr:DNA-directed RNA polymerase [Halomonas venusta]GEK52381.1 hypothetical protein HVE01_31020 [Halomonas venusta]